MTTIPRKDVVVGDIVILNTGDEIPADGELLDAVTLSVDESTLTGEPLCVKTTDEEHFDKDATYPSNHAMRGTKVMEGHGVMRVLKVGDATEMGKVFEEAQIDDSVKTPLNEQLDGLADWITNVSYIFAGLIIVGQLIHFLGWGAWQAWMLIIPVALFFWLVIKKFEDWSKAKCIFTIISFFCYLLCDGDWCIFDAQSQHRQHYLVTATCSYFENIDGGRHAYCGCSPRRSSNGSYSFIGLLNEPYA